MDSFYSTIRGVYTKDLAPERAMFQRLFSQSILKGILGIAICLILFGGSVYLNYRWLYQGQGDAVSLSTQNIGGQENQVEVNRIDIISTETTKTSPKSSSILPPGVGGTGNNTAEEGKNQAFFNYNSVVKSLISPLYNSFDSFVFTTVDPTGFSEIQSDKSIQFEPSISTDKKLKIGSGSYLFSTMKYSSLFFGIAGGILLLLVVLSGYQIMSNENGEILGEVMIRMKRIFVAGLLLFGLAPFLLSMSTVATQLVNQQIVKIQSGDCVGKMVPTDSSPSDVRTLSYSECIFDRVTRGFNKVPGIVEIDGWDLGGYINRFIHITSGYFTSIPDLILVLIILILLFVILIQFVVRYINLYFLFAFYPIVVVFWAFSSTQNYCKEYVKQIVTLLLHQPFFILAFMIFADISAGLVNTSGGFELPNLLLYTIFLGALTTMPSMVASRIFGDVSAAFDHARQSRRHNLPGRTVAAVGNYGNDTVRNQRDHRVKQVERGVNKYTYQTGVNKLLGKPGVDPKPSISGKKTMASQNQSHVKIPK
jgi:TrbL/VirB6 plasmid conjugal transfer protein